MYVVDSTNGDYSVLDVDATVHNAAFLDFSTFALAMMEHSMISAYDAAKRTEQWNTPVGADPLEVTLASGGRILVANSGDGTLSIVDAGTHSVVGSADVGEMHVGGDDVVEAGAQGSHHTPVTSNMSSRPSPKCGPRSGGCWMEAPSGSP